MSATLSVRDLKKSFAIGRPAVDGVGFDVTAGEIIVLLGPSGCGKTTTLRCVAGLEHPTSGEIAIGGTVVSAPARGILVAPRARNIGMVFQSYAVWPHMTVRQNVEYPLRQRRMARAERTAKVAGALELVGLAEYTDRPVVALSGGQMQRVALARAIVYRPQLLLLDEPLSNLDAKLRLRLRDDLRRILKQAGMTALYVTHDQSEAIALGDRIAVMRGGRLLQLDTPDAIYNRPSALFVANFTGATNELTGRLASREGTLGRVEFGHGRSIEALLLEDLAPGNRVRIAFRPESIALVPAGTVAAFAVRVVERRYLGTQTAYDVDLDGARLEVLELGTASRHAVGGEAGLLLPREVCWAYLDRGPLTAE